MNKTKKTIQTLRMRPHTLEKQTQTLRTQPHILRI